MKKILSLCMVLITLLSGCATVPPTEPTDATDPATTVTTAPEPTQESTAATTAPAKDPDPSGPLLVKDYLEEGTYSAIYADYEVIIPENGVLILDGQETLEDVFIVGDVYITYNAEVFFRNVNIPKGKVYCHGVLRRSGINHYDVYGYHTTFNGLLTCSAFDGTHGRIINEGSAECRNHFISTDALDYAFEAWGNYGPDVTQPEVTASKEPVEPLVLEYIDERNETRYVNIFTGTGRVSGQQFAGDVYITRDAVIEFEDVRVGGYIYCYGQLKISDDEQYSNLFNDPFENNHATGIYAYSFQGSCDAFDGVHGLVVGGPIYCDKIVVADDALDYIFDKYGK